MKVAICSAWLAAMTGMMCAAAPQQKPSVSEQTAPPSSAARPAVPAVSEASPAKLAEPGTKPAANADPSYVIGPEDVLAVSVWGDQRLSGPVLVRPDGRISLALIGEITASGMTPGQLESAIAEQLKTKQILVNPAVTVQVTQILSKKYFLQGEVLKPGQYPLVVPTTVLEALVNAGGFKDFANMKKIEIIRTTRERFKFNYKEVIHGKHAEQNILLKPGDIIVVP